MHTTNYTDTFIAVAADCPVTEAEIPERKASPSVATLQYEMISAAPYTHTSDEVIFAVHAIRNGIPKSEWKEARALFFSKGQACLRASPLSKRYGFGIHSDAKGRVALVPLGSKEYSSLASDKALVQVKAMRSKRA